jgi:RNA 3'-terminal phosphate cyclase (ATP)
MTAPVVIDGSHGEGGGQVVRTALTLSAVTGQPVLIENIRAGRPKPGLAAQHLAAARAVAAICDARLVGDALGSKRLEFTPGTRPRPETYLFDVAAARLGGSAGSTTLVLQSVLVPLALAGGHSDITVRGGTHVRWSPPFDQVRDVWLPTLARLGIVATANLVRSGWYPAGGGEIRASVGGPASEADASLLPLGARERGPLRRIFGRAIAANLPAHIPTRMTARAYALLADLDVEIAIEPALVVAACPGTGIFLTAEYEAARAGFSALGERGKPSEAVAEAAVAGLLDHFHSGAALDSHLADQILVPLALAAGPSQFTVERVTEHVRTNGWVIGRFGLADMSVDERPGGPPVVTVTPRLPVLRLRTQPGRTDWAAPRD